MLSFHFGKRTLIFSAGFFGVLCLFWELSGADGGETAAILLAILLHEGGHLAAFRRTGIPVQRITFDWNGVCIRPGAGFYPFFSTLCTLLGGSAASFLAAGLSALLCLPSVCAKWQLICGIFSLLPLPGLDGGEVVTLLFARFFPDRTPDRLFLAARLTVSLLLLVLCRRIGSVLPLVWGLFLWI
jgi:hypothetical protein